MSPRQLLLTLMFVASARTAVGQKADLPSDIAMNAPQTVQVDPGPKETKPEKPVSPFVKDHPDLAAYDSIVQARGATATLVGVMERKDDYPIYRFETFKNVNGHQLHTTEDIVTDSVSVVYDYMDVTYNDMHIRMFADVGPRGYTGPSNWAFTNMVQHETGDIRLYNSLRTDQVINTLFNNPEEMCKEFRGMAARQKNENLLDVNYYTRTSNGASFIDPGHVIPASYKPAN